ncbi:MAG: response regulator [Bacteroidota bacterium]
MNWSKIFVHPLFVGFVLSVLAIFAFTRFFSYHKFEVADKTQIPHNGEVYFCDFDMDGNSEKFHFYNYDRMFFPTLYQYGPDDDFKCMWSFFDQPVKNSRIFFGDYNDDTLKEIFIFTQQQDSVFLYVLNPKNDKEFITKRKFIALSGKGSFDFKMIPIGLFNLSDDKSKDFYFALSVDNRKVPGKIFAYDIFNDSVYHSPDVNAKILDLVIAKDINSDGYKELLISTEAKANDTNGASAVLLVLDHQLKYFFKPVKLQGNPSRLFIDAVIDDQNNYIVALNSGKSDQNIFNHLMLFDINGNRIAEKSIDFSSNLVALNSELSGSFFTLFSGQQLIRLNAQLEIIKKKFITRKDKLKFISSPDINNDGLNEHIFAGENSLYFLSHDYKKLGKQKINTQDDIILTLKKTDNKIEEISFQAGNDWYLVDYKNDSASFYKYFIYLILFIIVTFMIFIFRNFLNKRRATKHNSNSGDNQRDNKRMVDPIRTKFKDVKAETDFNTLNGDDEQFGNPLNQVKEKSTEYKSNQDLKSIIEQLTANPGGNIELTFYPKGKWYEIDKKIKTAISKYLQSVMNFLEADKKEKNIHIRILRHTEYLNILLEIEKFDDKDIFIKNKPDIESILSDVHGKFDIDFSPGIGTIASVSIPLGEFDTPKSEKSKKIRLIIAEDHDVSLFGLVTLFKNREEFEIIDTAKNGMEVLKILEKKNTDIIITDISMPGMDGIELAEHLNIHYPEIKVIVFTMYMENWFVEQLTKNGAKGFVAKNSKITELVDAVHHVYEGYNYYCPQFKSKYGFNNHKENNNNNQLDSLNKYETEILKYFAQNFNTTKIAETLNINSKTFDTFIANIMLKLNAGDINEVIRIAKKQEYISG